ncbi:MAG: hypothetical protein IT182_11830 [Acidobacteria bacterium]|nr:hypothetical protein [Acidobacteriota bacterium]
MRTMLWCRVMPSPPRLAGHVGSIAEDATSFALRRQGRDRAAIADIL